MFTAAGSSNGFTLQRGLTLVGRGSGMATFGPGRSFAQPAQLSASGWVLGPYQADQTIYLFADTQAGSPGLVYDVVAASASTGLTLPGINGAAVAVVGDSLQQRGFVRNGAPRFGADAAINWVCALLGQSFSVPFGCSTSYTTGQGDIVDFCLAVSGSTTEDLIAQVQAAIALRPAVISIQSGTNDLVLLANQSAAQIFLRLELACQMAIAAGIDVWLWTIPPRNNSSGAGSWTSFSASIVAQGSTIAAQRAKHMQLNELIRGVLRRVRNVLVLDPYSQLVDTASGTDDWRASLAADAVHWNAAGAFVAAQAVLPAIASRARRVPGYTSGQLDAYSATNPGGNLIPASTFDGVGGTVSGAGITGTAPTGWTLDLQSGAISPGAAAVAAQARTDVLPGTGLVANGREFSFTLSGSVPGAFQARAYQTASTSLPANVPFFAEADFLFSAMPGSAPGPSLQAFINSGAVNGFAMQPDASGFPVGSTFLAKIRTPWMRHTAATSGLLFSQFNGIANSQYTARLLSVNMRPAVLSDERPLIR